MVTGQPQPDLHSVRADAGFPAGNRFEVVAGRFDLAMIAWLKTSRQTRAEEMRRSYYLAPAARLRVKRSRAEARRKRAARKALAARWSA